MSDPIVDSLKPVSRESRGEARPSFALATTMLCAECEHCYEAHVDGCPTCGSQQAFPVARRMDATATTEEGAT